MKLVISPNQVAAAKAELASRRPRLSGLVKGSRTYRILRRLEKIGPMTPDALSRFLCGVRQLPDEGECRKLMHYLSTRAYVRRSKAKAEMHWSITREGRLALRSAAPDPNDVKRIRDKERDRIAAKHEAHVAVQRLMGLPEELIHAPVGLGWGMLE